MPRCSSCGASRRAFSTREGYSDLCVFCAGDQPDLRDPIVAAIEARKSRLTFHRGMYNDEKAIAEARKQPGQGHG